MMEIKNLCKTYTENGAEGAVCVFKNLNFKVDEGEFISIVGPNGCGKTTLLRVIAGLAHPTSGTVSFIGGGNKNNRSHVGFVFQENGLFPWRTAVRNIEIGLEFSSVSKKKRRMMALEYMNSFDLSGFENKYPRQLSGGMKQRVAIARTLINNPDVVLMDEPFASLDAQTRNSLQDYLLNVWRKRKDTIIFVTHNVDEAVYMSDKIILLSQRPSHLVKVFDVNIERPRNRVDPEFCRIRKGILELISNTGEEKRVC